MDNEVTFLSNDAHLWLCLASYTINNVMTNNISQVCTNSYPGCACAGRQCRTRTYHRMGKTDFLTFLCSLNRDIQRVSQRVHKSKINIPIIEPISYEFLILVTVYTAYVDKWMSC